MEAVSPPHPVPSFLPCASIRGVARQTVVGPSSGTDTISSVSFLPSQASCTPGKVSEAVECIPPQQWPLQGSLTSTSKLILAGALGHLPSKTIYNVFSDCGLLLIAEKYISREICWSHGEEIKETLPRKETAASGSEGDAYCREWEQGTGLVANLSSPSGHSGGGSHHSAPK